MSNSGGASLNSRWDRWDKEPVPHRREDPKRRRSDLERSSKVCYDFQKGRCSRGESCRYSHEGEDAKRQRGSRGEKPRAPRWGKAEEEEGKTTLKPEEKEKANFGLSGALNEDEETGKLYKGVLLKWSEPPDAHLPKTRWRLYVFKKQDCLDTLHLHRQSAFLFGREKKIADVYIEHPSCSKQHAVLQFKIKVVAPEAGSIKRPKRKVRPYILDLESTNGTFLNGEKVPASRYVELKEKDVLKFGESSREYVLLSEKSSSKS